MLAVKVRNFKKFYDETANDALRLSLDEVKQQKNTPPQECRVCVCH